MGEGCNSNWAVQVGFSEEVIVKQRLKGEEGVSPVAS